MSKKENSSYKPALRFTQTDGRPYPNWEVTTLNRLAKRITLKNAGGKVTRVLTNSAAAGVVDQRDYFEKDIANQSNLDGCFIVEQGDYVYNPRVSTSAPVGPISRNKIGTGVMSPIYTVFRFNNSNDDFYEQYFKSAQWHKYLRMVSNSGARHDRMTITANAFMDMPLPAPHPEEQLKIADCLLSIDELIIAQAQKIETLKAHKKGLTQQLFPAEGETIPKLRFPEFRDAGVWGTRALGKYLLSHPDYGLNAPAVPYSEELPTYLRITDISEAGYFLSSQKVSVDAPVTAENYLNEGELVVARTGASVGKSYRYRKDDGKLVFAGFLIRVKPNSQKLNPEFLFHFLSSDHYWSWVTVTSARSGQPGINGNEYALLPVPVPASENNELAMLEQQKIADCLSSIDELLAAQVKKVEALKDHKKGLMQQLFPSIDEVNG